MIEASLEVNTGHFHLNRCRWGWTELTHVQEEAFSKNSGPSTWSEGKHWGGDRVGIMMEAV